MKHHFGDFLDRDGNYWTVVPNRERYSYLMKDIKNVDEKSIEILTITKSDENWRKIFSYPKLIELTLHEPNKEQVIEISNLQNLRRLRITHFRAKDIKFISKLINLEELVLEYVSGFSDLSPLISLDKLKSIHLENLRRVKNFGGLSGLLNLKYLSIDGTLDWKQPIENFDFLNGLPKLEIFKVGQVITKAPYPELLPLCKLRNLKRIRLPLNMFSAEEYALVSTALQNIEGADFSPVNRFGYLSMPIPDDDPRINLSDKEIKAKHPEVRIIYDGSREIMDPNSEWFDFIGKGSGRIKCSSPNVKMKCEEFIKKYNKLIKKAKETISL